MTPWVPLSVMLICITLFLIAAVILDFISDDGEGHDDQ